MATLTPFSRFKGEAEAIGRMLLGYSNLEIGLMHCAQMALGGNLDTALKTMFRVRSETKRINHAETLAASEFAKHKLTKEFAHALAIIRRCLQIRNPYAHWALWDDNSGKLAFANIEQLAKRQKPVRDLAQLRTFHVSATLLAEQEAYFVYCDRYTSWLNFEIRTRSGKMPKNIMKKPTRIKKPRLKLR